MMMLLHVLLGLAGSAEAARLPHVVFLLADVRAPRPSP
jgi:hypothetical protein